jgi:hypothetical protein
MFWLWYICLCGVLLRGIIAHGELWHKLDIGYHLPPFALISALIADCVIPIGIALTALSFMPIR